MTVENCLKLAKEWKEGIMDRGILVQKPDMKKAAFYMERAVRKLNSPRHTKYRGLKIEGFKLVKDVPEVPKQEVKPNGKKPKG